MSILSGFVDALAPELQEITKERRKRSRPGERLQADVFRAIQDASQAPTRPEVQGIADAEELKAASGQYGMRPNLNALIGNQVTASPEAVGRSTQGMDFLKRLQEAGVTSLGSDSMGMSRYGSGMVNPIVFDPSGGGRYIDAVTGEEVRGPIQRGAPVRVAQTPLDTEVDRRKRLAAAGVEGRGPSVKDDTFIETFDSSLRSIDKIEKNLSSPQGSVGNMLQAAIPGIPGQTGLAFEINNVADNLLRLKSGAQINEHEYRRLRALLPEIWDGPGVAQRKLAEFKSVFQTVVDRQKQRFGIEQQIDLFRQQLEDQGLVIEEVLD